MERVGGRRTIQLDVRVIGAANVDLPSLARSGAFRADLLDRLAFEVVTIPPLRARPADIMTLARMRLLWRSPERWAKTSSPGSVRLQRRCCLGTRGLETWRELKNVIERAVYRSASFDAPIDAVVIDPFDNPVAPASRPGRCQYQGPGAHSPVRNVRARRARGCAGRFHGPRSHDSNAASSNARSTLPGTIRAIPPARSGSGTISSEGC